MSSHGRPSAPRCLLASSCLLLLLCLGVLSRGAAAATCGYGPFSCPASYSPVSPSTPCITCGATECCKPGAVLVAVSPSPGFAARWLHCMVTVNNQLMVIAGTTNNDIFMPSGLLSDAWSTAQGSGSPWTQRTAAAGFSARAAHRCTVVGSTVYVIAGLNAAGNLQDVWSTTDVGATFTSVTSAAAFPPRDSFGSVFFLNALWVIAGWSNGNLLNDIWTSTTNGATWSLVTPTGTVFSGRSAFGMAVFANKIWMVGGGDATSMINEVWSTPDGASWTNVPQLSPIAPRGFGVLFQHATGMVFTGGASVYTETVNATSAQTWATYDGVIWTSTSPLPTPLMGLAVSVLGYTVYITGGSTGTAISGTEYASAVNPSCASTNFACPVVYAPLNPYTLCSGTSCVQADCCSTSLVASASQYLVIVLSVDCSLYTPTTFALKIAQATGIPVEAIVTTYFGCSSLTVYITLLGSTTALADAALALVAQVALSGVLGPVVKVYFTASPAPAPTPTTTTTYPTIPFFRAPASSSNPALLGLLALLILPLLCCWLIFLRPRQQCCMAAPVCCGGPQPMAPCMTAF